MKTPLAVVLDLLEAHAIAMNCAVYEIHLFKGCLSNSTFDSSFDMQGGKLVWKDGWGRWERVIGMTNEDYSTEEAMESWRVDTAERLKNSEDVE